VQERHVGGADERGIGAPAERGEPGGDPLHRALALPGVVDHDGALRQIRQILAAGSHHHDRPFSRACHDADRPAQQRRPVPLQRCLGRAHPRGPAAGQHHARGTSHFFMVCITRGREPSRQAEAVFLGLLARAEAHAVDDLQRARMEQLRGQVGWRSVTGREAPVLLLRAAKRLESLDARLARETYLHAWVASHLAGPLAGPGGLMPEVSRAAQAAPRPAGPPRPWDLLLDGLTTMIVQGRAAAEPAIRRAVDTFLGDQVSGEEWLQWGVFAQMAAMAAWDFDSWAALSARNVELARALGALAPLTIA